MNSLYMTGIEAGIYGLLFYVPAIVVYFVTRPQPWLSCYGVVLLNTRLRVRFPPRIHSGGWKRRAKSARAPNLGDPRRRTPWRSRLIRSAPWRNPCVLFLNVKSPRFDLIWICRKFGPCFARKKQNKKSLCRAGQPVLALRRTLTFYIYAIQ